MIFIKTEGCINIRLIGFHVPHSQIFATSAVANDLDPNQARQNVGPDLDPNYLTLMEVLE